MQTYSLWDKVPGNFTDEPVIDYYPAKTKRTKAAVVVFPGGGYATRAPHEGKGYAEYLNTLGLDAFVVQYRVAPHHFPLPLLDARRALRYVRFHAEKFGVDKDRLAVMGSSAGGHLAAFVSTYREPLGAEWEGLDEIDKENFLPNATILCYPVVHLSDLAVTHVGSCVNLLGLPQIEKAANFDPVYLVDEHTPPAFVWHTSDDGAVNVKNSLLYGCALRDHGVLFEMHIFPHGQHGLGLAPDAPHVAQWTSLLVNWLKVAGFLPEK